MVFKDYYKILGLDSNKVTLDEIKVAYREQAKKYHPDKNVGNNEIEEIFKDINEAYRVLSNEKSRRKYDFQWHRYANKQSSTSTKEEKKSLKEIIKDIFFGGTTTKKVKNKKVPQYGEDVVTEIEVTIDEAFYGTSKKVKLRTVEGKETAFTVRIPAGVQRGDKIRIVGQGKPGKNGGKNGDLMVIVSIKDGRKIKLDGTDLVAELPLKVWEAALGTTKHMEIFGEDISIIVPEKTSSNTGIVIRGKGYKDGKGTRGNLRISTQIEMPEEFDDATRKLYEKLKQLEMK